MSGGLRISCFDACALQEDDTRRFWTKPLGRYFNPRPPCGGRSPLGQAYLLPYIFQSTSSVWRTTYKDYPAIITGGFQSTSSVRRTTAVFQVVAWCDFDFNPRPPCGGRLPQHHTLLLQREFQSTSSVWRTTPKINSSSQYSSDFNPRPPCGGRPVLSAAQADALLFQSTSSVWRTTS